MRNAIVRVFSTKYSLTLPTQSLLFIESVLTDHDIEQEEWNAGLELWAKEYLKGEDPSPLVSLKVLQRAYESLQLKNDMVDDLEDPSEVHLESYFNIIDAFDMPAQRFDAVRNAFALAKTKPGLAGSAVSRAAFLRERWAIIKQIVLRNENFMPPALGGRDRADYLKLTSTRNLLGRANQLFLLFGMLSRNPTGELILEDGEGSVVLDMREAVPGEGLYTEGCMVLVEGEYTEQETVKVLAMGHPPSEKRDAARAIFGHVDFLGCGATSLKEEEKYRPIVAAHADINFVVLSDVWLDHPKTLPSLKRLFDGYSQADVRPFAFVLCGNFSTRGWEGKGNLEKYTDGFKALADLIVSFPLLLAHSHFIFVPGPTDPWSSSTVPRPPIPESFVKPILSKIPKARFTSNPCRIRYFDQEIVVFREDLMSRMLRNLVTVKEETKGDEMKRFLVQTVLDQIHLSPLPINVRPTVWEWDHALRLYPMPTTLILADKHERYDLTYEGCHVFNPGGFVGNQFEWSVYYPATGRSELSALPEEQ